ncbi:reverse transcriptase [Lithospermum erythrorhizon]|uniref:Reverse transcriptase n=1 Tax=Lithospermum erythrorhizon TaxID=34254 RepID=A0AAV3NY58_LITER
MDFFSELLKSKIRSDNFEYRWLEEARMSGILGIPVASLLVRYLGIPLTTKQLSSHDYRVLVEKIRGKIEGWGNKNLSFAGRLTLINSVIFGVCNYWYQTTFIPKKTVKEIEKLMKSCSWKGSSVEKFPPKVSWKQATLKKSEGGLGVKIIQTWNMACMAKHIWDLCTGNEALWVKWINTVRLKGQSFWGIKVRGVDSWVWKKMLTVREDLKENVKYRRVKNGKTVNCRYNN